MRILVLHAWLKGNLGDVLQLSVLLSALRELEPAALDVAGFPPHPPDETTEVLRLADRYLPDPFPWFWSLSPRPVGTMLLEPWWRARRTGLFSRYDAIVCAPGPYLAEYDPRATSALADITSARELDRPVVLSSHSIGPLPSDGLSAVAKATLCVARELSTHRYLSDRRISNILSADFAFLYPYERTMGRGRIPPPYRLVFLRSNNLNARALRLEAGALFEGSRLIADAGGERLVLATSDRRRDERFLARVARRVGLPFVCCESVAEMTQLIGASSGVVSDRYHPAICAAALRKPAQILANRERHKMLGLEDLLAGNTLEQLQELARSGLRTVKDVLRPS